MAEYVEQRVQKLVPLFQSLQGHKVVTQEELIAITDRYKDLEYKVQKQQKTLDDLQNLINFILKLKELLLSSTKSLNLTDLQKEINEQLNGIISSHFGVFKRHFGYEKEFWIFWIQVYARMGWWESIRDICNAYSLTLGQTDPSVWIAGANLPLKYKGEHGIEEAREIMQQCVRRHSNMETVYINYCVLELQYIQILKNSDKKENARLEEVSSDLRPLWLVYEEALTKPFALKPYFYCDLNDSVAERFPCATEFKDRILQDLSEKCAKWVRTYTYLANLHLNGPGGLQNEKNIMACFTVFEKGLRTKEVDENNQQLFRSYLSTIYSVFLQLRNMEGNSTIHSSGALKNVVENLYLLYERAEESIKISKEDYLNWIEVAKIHDMPIHEPGSETAPISFEEYKKRAQELQTEAQRANAKTPKKRKKDELQGMMVKLELEEPKRKGAKEIAEMALKLFPNDWVFVGAIVYCIIENPINYHIYYGKDRVQQIIRFLVDDSKSKRPWSEGAKRVWSEVFYYTQTRIDCSPLGELGFIVTNVPDEKAQIDLAKIYMEYLFMMNWDAKATPFVKLLPPNIQKPIRDKITELIRRRDYKYEGPAKQG